MDEVYMLMYTLYVPKSYSVASARAKLAEIVDAVEAGKEIEITRRGKKVAVLVSAARYSRLRGESAAFIAAFDGFRRDHDLQEVGIDKTWARKLRDRSPGRAIKL